MALRQPPAASCGLGEPFNAGEEVKEEYKRAGLFNLLSSIIHRYCYFCCSSDPQPATFCWTGGGGSERKAKEKGYSCLVVETDTLVDFERVHNLTVFISDLCFTSPDLDWSLGWFTVSPGEASLQHAVESVFVTAR